jgi:hypothetical protein
VVIPETVLIGGALGSLRRPDRLLPKESEITPGVAGLTFRDERLLELTPWTQGELSAERSLEVAPLHHFHRGTRVAHRLPGYGERTLHGRRRLRALLAEPD